MGGRPDFVTVSADGERVGFIDLASGEHALRSMADMGDPKTDDLVLRDLPGSVSRFKGTGRTAQLRPGSATSNLDEPASPPTVRP